VFVYRFEVFNKREVGYQRRVDDIIADIVYGLLLLLVYAGIVLIFRVELIIGNKLVWI